MARGGPAIQPGLTRLASICAGWQRRRRQAAPGRRANTRAAPGAGESGRLADQGRVDNRTRRARQFLSRQQTPYPLPNARRSPPAKSISTRQEGCANSTGQAEHPLRPVAHGMVRQRERPGRGWVCGVRNCGRGCEHMYDLYCT